MESLIEAMPAPVFFKDTDHVYRGCNQAFAVFLGLSKENIVGKSVFDIAPRELAEIYRAQDEVLFKNPGLQIYDTTVENAEGAMRHAMVHKATFANRSGHVAGLIGVISDVTERKKGEESLARANQEWERTFNAISDLVMVLDDQHKILRANKAMAEALGMTEQEVTGKHCYELLHGEKDPPVFCPHSRLLADGGEHSAEVAELCLGGIYDVRVSPLVGQNGQVIGSVHVTRDITERKSVEERLHDSEERLRMTLEVAQIGIGT